MGLVKEIADLKSDISEREAVLIADKATVRKKEEELKKESTKLYEELEKEADAYTNYIKRGLWRQDDPPKYPGKWRRQLGKVILRYPSASKNGLFFHYVPASAAVMISLGKAAGESKVSQSDPRLSRIQSAIIGGKDGVMIECGGDQPVYREKFLPIVLFFAMYLKYDIDDAIEATKNAMEGRTGYKFEDINQYLYTCKEEYETENSAEEAEGQNP